MRMNLRSVPAYSFGSKTNTQNTWIQPPGVGNYEMDHKNVLDTKSPKFSFGRGDKLKEKDITPRLVGPGTYNTNLSTMSKKLATPLKGQRGKILHETYEASPGPGTHDPTQSNRVYEPKYSFNRDRLKTLTGERKTVGPADYRLNHGSVEAKVPNGKFSQNQNQSCKEMSPGPGQYDWEKSPTGGLKAKWHRDSRRPPEHGIGCTGNLGPGNYIVTQEDLCNNGKKNQGYTMRPKTNADNTWIKPPGPGNYDPNDQSKKTKFSVPRTARMDIFNPAGYNTNKNPGPGQYYPNSFRTTKVGNSFANEQRPGFADLQNDCGPGQYNAQKVTEAGSKYSFRRNKRQGLENEYANPGPGTYKTQDTKVRNPSYGLGTSKKCVVTFDKNPGSGAHDPSFEPTRKKSNTGYSLSRNSRFKDIKATPGAGHYDVRRTVPDIPAYLSKSVAMS